jgi:hypothetical protein
MHGGGHSLRLTLAQEPRRKRFFSIGCWFTAGFVAGNNSDLGAALIVLTEVGLFPWQRHHADSCNMAHLNPRSRTRGYAATREAAMARIFRPGVWPAS